MFKSFWRKLRRIYTQLFTDQKFPDKDRKSIGGKKIGEVYDIDYMPSPDNPGEVMITFDKKDQEK